MSQGSINMPALRPAQIGAIAQALEAVHAYYGIDTQKEQQALLKAQTRGASAEAESKEMQNSALKDWMNGSDTPAPASVPTSSIPAPAIDSAKYPLSAGAAQNSSVDTAPIQPPIAPPVNAPSTPMHGAPRNPFLLEFMKKQQDLTNSQLEGQIKAGQVAQIPENRKKAAFELSEIDQRIRLAATESQRKGEDQLLGVGKDFAAATKDSTDQIAAAQSLAKAFTSGNPTDINIAKAQLPLVVMGIKRMGGDGSIVDSKAWRSVLDNWQETKQKGLPAPAELANFVTATNRLQQSASDTLNSEADKWSQRAANIGLGNRDSDFIKNKVLLPTGTQMNQTNLSQSLLGAYRKRVGTVNASTK